MKRAWANDNTLVMVAVMGATGTGKSTFVKLLTNDDSIHIDHNQDPETCDIRTACYVDRTTGRTVMLIDTPGFDDSREGMTDTDILQKIVQFLEPESGERRKLNGLIYMHRISDPRVGGVSRKNLRMFRSLCGEENLGNVRIVTTNWNRVSEQEGRRREAELTSRIFKVLLDAGAQIRRHANTFESAQEIVSALIYLRPVAMQIQDELCQGKTLADTAAGRILTEQMWEIQQKHKEELDGRVACVDFMDVNGDVLKTWTQNDPNNTESTLSDEIAKSPNPSHHMFANRALIRARLSQWTAAVKDARRSLRIQLSPIGHIAMAIALAGQGDQDGALREFDLSFRHCGLKDIKLLLLLRSLLSFTFGKHQDAILRVRDLFTNTYDDDEDSFLKRSTSEEHTTAVPCFDDLVINTEDDDTYCFLQVLGNMYLKTGEYLRAIEVFERAKRMALPDEACPPLTMISLIFSWSFEGLDIVVQRHLCESLFAEGRVKEAAEALLNMLKMLGDKIQASKVTTDWVAGFTTKCVASLESLGDIAFGSATYKEAVEQYTAALSLVPQDSAILFIKRSKAMAAMVLWDDALSDANKAIEIDPSNHLAYECKYVALHGAKRYDEAIEAFGKMFSLIEQSSDPKIRALRNKYISPSQTIAKIKEVARLIAKISPLVLIDVQTGRLCDAAERMAIFKSDSLFKELVSSMTQKVDEDRILRVVAKFFGYAMFSHVWEGKEPSYQDVNLVQSVHDLPKTHMNAKLRRVCEEAGKLGNRFLWSDTCCIDKTTSAILNQSLTSMYVWYAGSVITIVFLAGVKSPSKLGDLTNSKWMTRAWTLQELLSPKTIRFYDSQWQLYLGDTRLNHKESPEIMKELSDAFQIPRDTIVTFSPDDLAVRDKLRLASTRDATVEEDVAYSLIGIFKSDIRPHYGEGEAALGHLLEEIVARSGEVSILAWTGTSSSYNSCLPSTLSAYNQTPYSQPTLDPSEMETRTTQLRNMLPREDAMMIYQRVAYLLPARFANRRLHLPCILFRVRKLGMQSHGTGPGGDHYRVKASGLGFVDIRTTDKLPLAEPRRLMLVHPWISYIRGPRSSVVLADDSDSDTDSESDRDEGTDEELETSAPMTALPVPQEDEYTRALKSVVRLGQPFNALLLLQQQPGGEYKRVGTENEIVVQGLGSDVKALKEIRADVLEIL